MPGRLALRRRDFTPSRPGTVPGPATYLVPPLLPCVSSSMAVPGRRQDSASARQAGNVCESTCPEQVAVSYAGLFDLDAGCMGCLILCSSQGPNGRRGTGCEGVARGRRCGGGREPTHGHSQVRQNGQWGQLGCNGPPVGRGGAMWADCRPAVGAVEGRRAARWRPGVARGGSVGACGGAWGGSTDGPRVARRAWSGAWWFGRRPAADGRQPAAGRRRPAGGGWRVVAGGRRVGGALPCRPDRLACPRQKAPGVGAARTPSDRRSSAHASPVGRSSADWVSQ